MMTNLSRASTILLLAIIFAQNLHIIKSGILYFWTVNLSNQHLIKYLPGVYKMLDEKCRLGLRKGTRNFILQSVHSSLLLLMTHLSRASTTLLFAIIFAQNSYTHKIQLYWTVNLTNQHLIKHLPRVCKILDEMKNVWQVY